MMMVVVAMITPCIRIDGGKGHRKDQGDSDGGCFPDGLHVSHSLGCGLERGFPSSLSWTVTIHLSKPSTDFSLNHPFSMRREPARSP
jgi:hypothetical protein